MDKQIYRSFIDSIVDSVMTHIKHITRYHHELVHIYRDGEEVSADEVYARVKLNVIHRLIQECMCWEDRVYTGEIKND